MASQDESPLQGLKLYWPALGTVLITVWGLIIARPALVSSRPTSGPVVANRSSGDGRAPARLWQDPLTAVMGPSATDKAEQPDIALSKIVGRYCGKVDRASILFLFVCIDPQISPEAAEGRRRERYATLSALSTAGYAPDQADKIGYIKVLRETAREKLDASSSCQSPLPEGLVIPYEWAQPLSESEKVPLDAVCVVWLGEDFDCSSKLASLIGLKKKLESLADQTSLTCRFAVTGRLGSSQLAGIIRADAKLNPKEKPLQGVTLYVTQSTAPFVREEKMISNSGLSLEYLIDTDALLANELMNELRNRGVKPGGGDPIAVIAEWDSAYGRNMYEVFQNAASPKSGEHTHVHTYAYLRGLDGKLPGEAKSGPVEEKGGENPSGGRETNPAAPTSKEAEGDPQVDYVRRLVDRMKLNHQDFKAIGVVGSDVYDKILLLQALQPSFPQALFFTTDLDVRLLQPGDFAFTRNLLIASHFGLFLRDELQAKIAPFRSGYDTSSYLGVLRAVNYAKMDDYITLMPEPGFVRTVVPKDGRDHLPVHLFEVGRSGAYELTLYSQEEDPLGSRNPRIKPWITDGFRPLGILFGLVLVAGLVYPVSRPWNAFVRSVTAYLVYPVAGLFHVKRRPQLKVPSAYQVTALVSFVLGLWLIVLIYLSHVAKGGEPFEVLEGLSVWPTVVIRFLACVLCGYYIVNAAEDLRTRNKKIREAFGFLGQENEAANTGEISNGSKLRRFWDSILVSMEMWWWDPNVAEVDRVWQEFEEHGRPGRRFWRCALMSAVYFLLFAVLWWLFDHAMVQARGWMAWWTNFVILLAAGGSLVGLLVFVVDCTLLCNRLVTYLSRHAAKWPENLLFQRAKERNLILNSANKGVTADDANEALDQWLRIQLIDEATNVVAQLIYFPFVVLLVLIVAQNRLFENWHWNIPLSLIAVLSACTALVCALLLQRSAKRAKEKSLEILDRVLLRRTGDLRNEHWAKIEQIKTDVAAVNSSAFAGFFQNPIVGAVLLPLGGGGGLAALEAALSHT